MERLERHRKENAAAQMTAVNSTVIIPPDASVLGDREFWRRNKGFYVKVFFKVIMGLGFFVGRWQPLAFVP